MKALSIRQPWAYLVANGIKTVENRTWKSKFRGQFLVHASQKIDPEGIEDFIAFLGENDEPIPEEVYLTGGVVGMAEIVDCSDDPGGLNEEDAEWFEGPYGFLLRNARPLPFHPAKGQLFFFELPFDEEILNP
jgi:hypothetical protein